MLNTGVNQITARVMKMMAWTDILDMCPPRNLVKYTDKNWTSGAFNIFQEQLADCVCLCVLEFTTDYK